jgi:glucose-1-phosphate thymidylyltransferase
LLSAFPFFQTSIVAFGFPDIISYPENAFLQLSELLTTTDSDVVLGLYPTDRPDKADMVRLDTNGRVEAISIKLDETPLEYAWIQAVWTPRFSQFLERYLQDEQRQLASIHPEKELQIGDVVQEAIHEGLDVLGYEFKQGSFIDIGTPEDLERTEAFLK